MHMPVNPTPRLAPPRLDRRQAVGSSLLVLAGLVLTGCAGRRGGWKPMSDEQLHGPIDTPPTRSARVAAGSGDAPTGVIPRREWTSSGPILSRANPMNGVNRITIHHDAINSASVRTKADAARRLNAIRSGHLNAEWADIGYHYIVDPAGRVWEGRPANLQGAHVKVANEHNLGVMVMGNFNEQTPTPEALSALDAFVGQLMRRHGVGINRVYTHQELMATACPGQRLQGYMVQTRGASGRLARA